jgi:hypothetical protein
MAGDDKKTPPGWPKGKPPARTGTIPGTGYQMGRPPQGRDVLTPLPRPADDFSANTPPPTEVGKRRPVEAVPEPIERGELTDRVDLKVRQVVASIPPPVTSLTKTDLARILLGMVATLATTGIIGLATCGAQMRRDVDDRPTRNEVREDIRRATEPLGQKLDQLLMRRP